MTSTQIRQSFLDFYQSKQHTIVPSSSLLPDSPNLLFTNAGMNQFVPIFLGQVKCPYTPGRAADTQKCIRAGGKHNDLEDVGLDTYHHTFFEMLGNWSFGDYFKKEAIEWAWELVVGTWKFPPQRLYATVYSPDQTKGDPSEFDQEAYDHWARLFTAAGLDPKVHVVLGGKKDNFWMMGDTGPCGPCSELHVDLTPNGDTQGALVNQGSAHCIEIWNLVFMQFNANPDGTFSPLPAKSVDTGMGFERVTGIIQNTRGFTDFSRVISNYETDIFRPIFDALEKLSGKNYASTLPCAAGSTGDSPVPVGDPPTGMGVTSASQTNADLQNDARSPSAGLVARQDGQVARATQSAPGAAYSRRNLPHFEKPWAIYHVIINTIAPRSLSPAARDVVLDCILHWRNLRYQLVAACVLPDHAHFIIQPGVKEEDQDGNPVFWRLSEILHSIKSYSAKEVNTLDNVTGTLWQEERYDRYMRGDADLQEKFHYICRNPWVAGLVQENEPWAWLWTPDIEAWSPYVSLSARKGSTGDSPVPVGDPPTGMGVTSVSQTNAGLQKDARSPSAGLVARQDGQVARATQEQIATDIAARKGSTGDSPVPVGDPPTGMGVTSASQTNAGLQKDTRSPSAGLVARQDGQVARATQEQIATDIAFRVIADHIRTLSFAIADGIQPGNTDRNYVLRRILRRAVRYGRTLGFHEPFFYKLVDVLADTMGDVFPEIRAKQKHVQDVIRTEEEAFNRTLDRGITIFENDVFSTAVAHAASNEGFKCNRRGKTGVVREGDELVVAEFDFMKDERTVASFSIEQLRAGAWRQVISSVPVVLSWDAFTLYDTYGFPLDLTELMARERGLTVDVEGFNRLMHEQKARARAAQKKTVIELSQVETQTPTEFVGFDKLETPAKVLEVVSLKDKTAVILDTSACYAEMGGQVGDTGKLEHGANLWRVTNTQKSGNTWLHFLEEGVEQATSLSRPATGRTERGGGSVETGPSHLKPDVTPIPPGGSPGGTGGSPVLPMPGSEILLTVDAPRRAAIQRHHTVTHLLHWALHEVVSKDASQKGSFVGPDKLTFDFNSAPLTPQQVADVERLVNERILENAPVSWTEVKFSHVKIRDDIMQCFGEKYGDWVRVVQIGGRPTGLDGYSMELCGGTHTRATGEIGLFRIVSETAIAAGVRRIEAVAGLEAWRRAGEELALLKNVAGRLATPIPDLDKKIENVLAQQRELEKQLRAIQQKAAAAEARSLLGKAASINGIPALIERFDADGDTLQGIVNDLKGQFKGVILLGGAAAGAVALVAAVSPEFTARIQAGKLIQQIAPIVGGKGGGRPDNARGGGKLVDKLSEALAKARSLLG